MIAQIPFIAAHIMEAVAFWILFSYRYESRHKRWIETSVIVVGYGIMYGLFCLNSLVINTIANIVIVYGMAVYLYQIKHLSAGIQSVLLYTLVIGSEFLVSTIMGICSPEFQTRVISTKQLLLFAISCKSTLIILVILICIVDKNNARREWNIGWLGLVIILLLMAVMLSLMIEIGYQVDLSESTETMFMLVGIIVFAEILLYLLILRHNQKKADELYHTQLSLQLEKSKADYYAGMIQYENHRQILIHDIKNHLYVLDKLSEQGDNSKIHQYIEDILNTERLKAVVAYSDSQIMNYILNRYATLMKEHGISYHMDVRQINMKFMNDTDVTALFSNLLDNAIEAAKDSADPYIDIHGYEDSVRQLYIITIRNSTAAAPVMDKNGQMLTTKSDKIRHGYGLQSVQNIINRYHGTMDVNYNTEDYSFTISICCPFEL